MKKFVYSFFGRLRSLRKRPVVVVFALLLLLLASTATVYAVTYSGKILPNTYLLDIDLGGKTPAAVETQLQSLSSTLPVELTIQINGQADRAIQVSDLQPTIDVSAMVGRLYSVGRTGSLAERTRDVLTSLVRGQRFTPEVTLIGDEAVQTLTNLADTIGTQAKDAEFVLAEDGTVRVQPEEEGFGVSVDELRSAIAMSLAQRQSDVKLLPRTTWPSMTRAELEPQLGTAAAILAHAPLTLTANATSANVTPRTIVSWLTYDQSTQMIALKRPELGAYLADIAQSVNRDAQNAFLRADNGTVTVDTSPIDGQRLNVDEAVVAVETLLLDRSSTKTLSLPVETVRAQVQGDTVDELGIKELIGRASTTFTGSPANRVHNITTGTRFLSGIVLAPGEEFSTVKALGAVDASTGYLPELVIANNSTVPEFGGGLCQVSTTLFRAIMDAGLPVTERTNHSYRVSYYEPPVGLDATIYLPGPDLKFKNDTPAHMLVQGKVEGMKVTFELYGTSDGRTATISQPTVTNITDPPEAQYVETDALPKGETKQIEKPHSGASATVTYTVMRDGKEINKQVFKSKYKAWAARYLVGTRE